MKRATMIAGAFALPMTLPLSAFSEEAVPMPTPDTVADTTACALGDGRWWRPADVASGRAESAAAVTAAPGAATVRRGTGEVRRLFADAVPAVDIPLALKCVIHRGHPC